MSIFTLLHLYTYVLYHKKSIYLSYFIINIIFLYIKIMFIIIISYNLINNLKISLFKVIYECNIRVVVDAVIQCTMYTYI